VYLQLTAIIADLRAAERRLRSLRDALPAEAWNRRPSPDRWSPAECVAHLNLTSDAFLPLLKDAIDAARRIGRIPPSRRYRRDFFGWMLWRAVTPSGTFKTKTPAPFVPAGDRHADALIADFVRLQSELITHVRSMEGLPIDRVKIVSPFNARVRYNVYSALTIIPRHQHRHLLQAERAAGVKPVSPADDANAADSQQRT
jgi:hypothetical protein